MLQEAMLNFALLGAEWVLWLLVILSIIGLTVTIERLVFFFKTSTDSTAVHGAIQSFLTDGNLVVLETTALGTEYTYNNQTRKCTEIDSGNKDFFQYMKYDYQLRDVGY